MRTIFLLFTTCVAFFGSHIAFAQCDSLNIGNDITFCEGQSAVLDAGLGYSSYLWNTGSTSQTITVTEEGDYWCAVEFIDSTNNLISNGDFSESYSGFQSDYIIGTGGPYGLLSDEGTYAVTTNANLVHINFSACPDHTTGDGNLMVVNGAPIIDQSVWYETIPVLPNTVYHFSGWFTSVHFNNPATLDMSINGATVTQVTLTPATCLWEHFFNAWNSGENTTATLRIVNQNTVMDGNDFAIDDITFFKDCQLSDTIHVSFAPSPQVDFGPDTVICEGASLLLDAGSPFTEYIWQDGSTGQTFELTQPGSYWVLVTNEFGCTGSDTLQVDVAPLPQIDLGNDTTLCEGDVLVLTPGNNFTSYIWQDNSTGTSFTASTSGIYWVTVYDFFGCGVSDTIQIDFTGSPNISLGPDTSMCMGEQIVLSPGSGYLSYTWQDNSANPSYTVTQAGWYWVTVFNGCSWDTDSVFVSFDPSPVVDLGSDTVICAGQNLLLEPGLFSAYVWQDGSDLPFFTVTTSGNYSVEVTNAFGCTSSDELFVDVSSPEINLGDDTLLCSSDSIILDAGEGFATYLWQDGSDNRYYTVTGGNTYVVNATNPFSCLASDSIFIELIQSPQPDLGGDQGFCAGDSLLLEVPAGNFSYYWNGEPGTNQLIVTDGGTYSLSLVNQCDSVSDEIYVSEYDVPQIDLGEDITAFPGDSVTLNAGAGFDSYVWQDGSGAQYMHINDQSEIPPQSIYYVEVANGVCKHADSIKVEFFRVWVPSMISPNGDGKNDIFEPDMNRWHAIAQHHIMVFNRWGEQVWKSDNFPGGWDGKQNGRTVADGTYFWILEVFYRPQNQKQILKGTLSVLDSGD